MTTQSLRALALLGFLVLPGSLPIAGQANAPEVSINGSLSAHSIHQDEPLQFTLTIKNKADAKTNPKASLRDVTLQGLPAGYSLDGEKPICVLPLVPPQTQSCDTGANFEAHRRVLLAVLSPGQSVTVQGYLKPNPDSAHKSAALTVVVAWTAAESGIASSQSASLGENQVLGTCQIIVAWLSDLFKLLAIPAVLALIGWWLNDQNRKRDNAFAEASRKSDEAFANTNRDRDQEFARAQLRRQTEQHEHEQQQAIRSETWKQMLLVSHKYAAECYLPLSLAADRLADNLAALAPSGESSPEKSPSLPPANPKVAFYYILLCGKRMAKTRKDTGGFYFKDLRGEVVAGQCWKRFREALFGLDEDAPFYVAALCAFDTIADIETYQAFKKKFEIADFGVTYNDGDIERAWTLFGEYVKAPAAGIPEVVKFLKGFYTALDYESNRPYKYWYGIHNKLVLDPDIKDLFRDILHTDGQFTPEQIKDYLAGREDT
jgi:hypothetical protein